MIFCHDYSTLITRILNVKLLNICCALSGWFCWFWVWLVWGCFFVLFVVGWLLSTTTTLVCCFECVFFWIYWISKLSLFWAILYYFVVFLFFVWMWVVAVVLLFWLCFGFCLVFDLFFQSRLEVGGVVLFHLCAWCYVGFFGLWVWVHVECLLGFTGWLESFFVCCSCRMIAKHNFFLGFVWVVAFWCRLWFWVAFWLCRLPQADGELRAFPTLPCDFSSIPPLLIVRLQTLECCGLCVRLKLQTFHQCMCILKLF